MKDFVVCLFGVIAMFCVILVSACVRDNTPAPEPEFRTEPYEHLPLPIQGAQNWTYFSLQEYGLVYNRFLPPEKFEKIKPYVDERTCPFTGQYNYPEKWPGMMELVFHGKKGTTHIVSFEVKSDGLNLRPVEWEVLDKKYKPIVRIKL